MIAVVNPLEYPGWDDLLAGRGDASFFHTTAWVRVLHDTYGHQPFYFCRIENRVLHALLPVMEVNSALTGRRGVSLPFTDFSPVLEEGGLVRHSGLFARAIEHGRERGWRHLECRGGTDAWPGATPSVSFYGHVVDLSGSVEDRLARLDGPMRRGIRRAKQTGLRVEFEVGVDAIRAFYRLHCLTRQRHGLPPQPRRFFENIAESVLGGGRGFVTVVRHGARAVACGVFFHYGAGAIYKFGASDFAVQELRANNLMMWESMERCARMGLSTLHLGRTSIGNEGLRRFKLALGAREERILCAKHEIASGRFVTEVDRAESWMNAVFRRFPLPLLRLAGRLLYPHFA